MYAARTVLKDKTITFKTMVLKKFRLTLLRILDASAEEQHKGFKLVQNKAEVAVDRIHSNEIAEIFAQKIDLCLI